MNRRIELDTTDASAAVTAGIGGDLSPLWAAFARPLRAFIARRAPAGIEPDDVVQEVFLRVVRHLPSLRDAERIEAWLYRIARNALGDAMRARQRRDGRTGPIEGDLPDESGGEQVRTAEAELAPCLAPMIARLAEPYRGAIELTSVQGLTQAEAATRAGISVPGMKSRVQRARAQLKEMLLRCCDVEVDRRHGVSGYRRHEPAPCTVGDESAAESRCIQTTAGASSRVSGQE